MTRRRMRVSMVSTTAVGCAAALFLACGLRTPGNAEPGGERVAVVAEPLSVANDGSWHWYQGSTNGLPDLRCMDNSETGFGMSVPANWNKKVLVWLDGGGLCWDAVTCTTTPGISPHVTRLSYGQNDFVGDVLSNTGDANYDVSAFNWSKPELQRGILDRTSIANPFQAYAYVFVPYCTGDAHAGNNWDCVPSTLGILGDKRPFRAPTPPASATGNRPACSTLAFRTQLRSMPPRCRPFREPPVTFSREEARGAMAPSTRTRCFAATFRRAFQSR